MSRPAGHKWQWGEPTHSGRGAGWRPGPHPHPPASVGFPQGEAPAAHSWCGLGGQELEKDVPPQLPRRGHRRPSEPQAGPAGPPPCPQPPSCHLPLSLLGKEEGLAHIPLHRGPSPHLAFSNLLPSLAGPGSPLPTLYLLGGAPQESRGRLCRCLGTWIKKHRRRPPFPPTWPPCESVSWVPTVCGLRWVPLNSS